MTKISLDTWFDHMEVEETWMRYFFTADLDPCAVFKAFCDQPSEH